jgi:hypothetical protein
MTSRLQQAIAELQKLSDFEQDAMAAVILAEIADEEQWQSAFGNSQEELSRLAEKVREDIRQGRVRDQGIDEL